MKNALLPILALAACLSAGGCTDSDWNHLLNFGGTEKDAVSPFPDGGEPHPATAAAAPASAEPANADFCRGVAAEDATRNGFDEATQKRVFVRSYTQCVATYTR